jgi:hypothetical protein
MSYEKLFIIGNGFDLRLRIRSGYSDFKEYLEAQDSELFDLIERYVPACNQWANLEQALGDLDVDAIVDDLGHFASGYGSEDWSDSGHHDFQYEVDKLVEALSIRLKAEFSAWIRSLRIPEPGQVASLLRTVRPGCAYLSFNYTSTLAKVYGIPPHDVWHIHGDALNGNADLVLGHAFDPLNRPSLNNTANIEDQDIRLTEAYDTIDEYFSRTFKPSRRIITENQAAFAMLANVSQVVVLGHSLSDVDRPYIDTLLRTPGPATAAWAIACRNDTEKADKTARLHQAGVHPNRIVAVHWDQL